MDGFDENSLGTVPLLPKMLFKKSIRLVVKSIYTEIREMSKKSMALLSVMLSFKILNEVAGWGLLSAAVGQYGHHVGHHCHGNNVKLD